MAKQFPGFSPKAITFFRQLARNNDRTWFAAHKAIFEAEVRRPMIELVGLLSDEIRRIAVDYVPEKPEKIIYRIYRDARFSNDKTPYKTHIGALFQHRRIPKNRGAGFYFQISHEGLGIAGGIYMPEPEQLQAVRAALAQSHTNFAKICQDKMLIKAMGEIQGDALARVPKGFDPQSPAAEWLKRKQLYCYIELDTKLATKPSVTKLLINHFKLTLPLIKFLNTAIIAGMGDEEESRPVRPAPMF